MKKSRRSKIRAPQSDGSYIVSPVTKLDSLIESNRSCFTRTIDDSIVDIAGQLGDRRKEARQQLLKAAMDHVDSYEPNATSVLSVTSATPIVLTGHQPDFFHPGVWFKNFLVSKLGRATKGISLNLIIDNDICSSRSIAVPSGSLENPQRKIIAFDSLEAANNSDMDSQVVPYEVATWNDHSITQAFRSKVANALKSLVSQGTILDQVGQRLIEIQSRCQNVGATIAQTRHLLELENQVHNLEIPLSRLCGKSAFHGFLFDLFNHAEQFQELYNTVLHEFRELNKVRSQSHPVPALGKSGNWLELPFWTWTSESPRRGPLYVRRNHDRFELTDLDQVHVDVSSGAGFSDDLGMLDRQGIAIRPRALMTTMFARVFLADLFVHGIGGAKYDELTDGIIQKFYGIRPPGFLTATSTHLLPLGVSPIDASEVARQQQQVRSLRFHPEKHFPQDVLDSEASGWIGKKNELLVSIPSRGSKKKWHLALEETNHAMQKLIQSELIRCQESLNELKRQQQKNTLLTSREYSFLLHPPSLIQVLHRISGDAVDKFV